MHDFTARTTRLQETRKVDIRQSGGSERAVMLIVYGGVAIDAVNFYRYCHGRVWLIVSGSHH